MNKNIVILVADKNYLEKAKQVFSSLYFNAEWDEDVGLITNSDSDVSWFEERGIIVFKKSLFKIQNVYSNKNNTLNKNCYLKYYIFADFLKKWNTVIYLDCDVIVMRNIDFLKNKKGFYAVRDYLMSFRPIVKNQLVLNNKISKKLDKKYDLNKISFNSGVMVFNPNHMHKNLLNDLISLTEKYSPFFKYYDQSALNLLIGEFKELPFVYNDSSLMLNDLVPKPFIKHFIVYKPWHKKNKNHILWRKNYEFADKINFSQPDFSNRKKYGFIYILFLDKLFKLIVFFEVYKFKIVNSNKLFIFINKKLNSLNSNIKLIYHKITGLIGKAINYVSPKLYCFLKRFK